MPKLRVEFALGVADALRAQARAAHPRECCGLLEGKRKPGDFLVTALHPTRNLSSRPDRFEMDPAEQFEAVRNARAKGTAIIGCYHSHPCGQAKPSAADSAGAGEEEFVWVIAAKEEISVFVYRGAKFLGADWVTSST